MPALVHYDVGVTALDGFENRRHIARRSQTHVPEIKIIRRPRKDDRVFFGSVFRAVNVRRHPLAVAHRHHHFAVDDGDVLQFFLDLIALGDQFLILFRTVLRFNVGNKKSESNDK